jgi:NifU-like protein involved in Fe-S cluster formation
VALYTPPILALAAQLANYPLLGDFPHRASARSRTCGSVIELGVRSDAEGRIAGVGMQVTACAIGQASAAIMAEGIGGARGGDVVRLSKDISRWLAGEGDLPDWPQLDLLAPVLPHKGRHGALLLPWQAVTQALCPGSASG